MSKIALRLTLLAVLLQVPLVWAQTGVYYPPKGAWATRDPAALGFDAAKLADAVAFAIAAENPAPKDMAIAIPEAFKNEAPYNKLIGPTSVRAAANGIVVKNGFVAAQWGDTARADMTHSITKTYLTTVIGFAFEDGKIRNLDDRAAAYMPAGVELFASAHNAQITWDHLLRQTSDWSGTLWDKPDWADRPVGKTWEERRNRSLHIPGTHFKYNDVRVNVLALAGLHVLRRPLPEILRERVMDPIGASDTWRWEGYENSWVEIDGRRVQSVSGGGHFGGGMFISAFDLARFGYLFLRNGRWQDRQLVSERWIALARTPGSANPQYGFANWYLNPDRKVLANAPASSVTFRGAGQNIIYIDWDNDLVAVVRWIRSTKDLDQFLGKLLASLEQGVSASAARMLP
jgi:CubicO group peptidase (beta-lactamase class C family)